MTSPPELAWTVVIENVGLVYKIVNDKCRRYQDRDDLIQEGMVGLFEAARRFDTTRQVTFATYAYHWILKRVLGFYQARSDDLDTDQLEDKHDGRLLTYDEETYIRSDLRKHLLRVLQQLDESLRLVIMLRWLAPEKLKLKAIASAVGRTPQAVALMEQEALQQLRLLLTVRRK